MRRNLAWFTFVFCSVPALFVACGGRTQISFDVDLYADPDAAAGAAGATAAGGSSAGGTGGSGKGGAAGKGAGGKAGASGAAGGTGGAGGADPTGGSSGDAGASGATTGGAAGKGAGGAAGKGAGGKGGGGKGMDAGDVFDAFPLPDSGPIGECVSCLANNCDAQINACYNNPNCLAGIQCSIQKCFAGMGAGGMGMGAGGGMGMGIGGGTGMGAGGGGGVNFQCILGCFNGDIGAAFSAIQAFQCVSMSCGAQCTGGLGMGGGGKGGNGGSTGMVLDPFGGGPASVSTELYLDQTRIPEAGECPGYPELQQALAR